MPQTRRGTQRSTADSNTQEAAAANAPEEGTPFLSPKEPTEKAAFYPRKGSAASNTPEESTDFHTQKELVVTLRRCDSPQGSTSFHARKEPAAKDTTQESTSFQGVVTVHRCNSPQESTSLDAQKKLAVSSTSEKSTPIHAQKVAVARNRPEEPITVLDPPQESTPFLTHSDHVVVEYDPMTHSLEDVEVEVEEPLPTNELRGVQEESELDYGESSSSDSEYKPEDHSPYSSPSSDVSYASQSDKRRETKSKRTGRKLQCTPERAHEEEREQATSADDCATQPAKRKRKVGNNSVENSVGLFEKEKVKDGCKQVYDKVNFCTFCRKPIKSKISRHLLSVHKDDPRLYDILTMAKRSKERMIQLEILANEGNFKHNIDVLRMGKGQIVVARRNSAGVDENKTGDYLPCEHCMKFILRTNMWYHHRSCSVKKFRTEGNRETSDDDGNASVNVIQSNAVRRGRSLLNSALFSDEDSNNVKKMIERMRLDEATEIVCCDKLIQRYAALRVESLGHEDDQKLSDMHRVSQGARTLARLVLEARIKKPTITMDELIKPEHMDMVVHCTRAMSVEKEEPVLTLGRLIGNLLGHVIQVKRGLAIRNNDNRRLDEADRFLSLFTVEWNGRINSACTKKMNTVRRNTIQCIPLTEDLRLIKEFILKEIKTKSAALKTTVAVKDWVEIAKLTMCRLILFNMRRRAEVKDLTVNDFVKRPSWKDDVSGEMAMALSPTDRLLAERMDMVIAAGKSTKNIEAFVLMPPDTVHAINLLIKTRRAVGIPEGNKYLFARPNANTPFAGNTELSAYASKCPGLQHPERITSRGLRKYIATVCQIMDMTEKEVESLATHLGHDVKTHKEYYRLQHSTVELSKISQLLIAVEGGQLNKWQGKKLSEIDVNEFLCEQTDTDTDTDTDAGGTEVAGEGAPDKKGKKRWKLSPGKGKQRAIPKQRKSWSQDECCALKSFFKTYLSGKMTSVRNTQITAAKEKYPCLRERTALQIRAQLFNYRKKT